MKTFTELLKESMAVGDVSIKDLAKQLNTSRNTLSSYLNGRELSEGMKQTLIEGVFKASKKEAGIPLSKILFVLGMPDFQKVGKGTTSGVVGHFITVELKEAIQKSIANRNDENLIVQSSVGQGTAARSTWVAIRDKRISPKGVSQGVYVVALFDSTGENLYLSIAYAVSNIKKEQLPEIVKGPTKKILDTIHNDPSFEGVISGPINLGETKGTIAELYEQSVIVAKPYRTLELNEEEFLVDVNKMLDLFYDFVYEDYLEELSSQLANESSVEEIQKTSSEEVNDTKEKKKKKENLHSTIDPLLYEQLLEERRKHNKEVGRKAEEFVYKKEQEKLLQIDRSDLLDKVVHVAKEKDGYGYDIKSVEVNNDGSFEEVFLEVKGSSMGGNENFDFYLTDREDKVAKQYNEKYRIVLVEYVGFSKQNIVDVFAPYNEEGNAVMEKKPTVFKCRYKKRK